MSARVEPGERDAPPALVVPPLPARSDNASLVEVAGSRLRAGLVRWHGSAIGRRGVAWCARPLVTTRGHVVLAACLIGVVLAKAAWRAPSPPFAARAEAPPPRQSRTPERAALPTVPPPQRPAPPAGSIGDPPEVAGIVGRLPGNAVVLVRGANGARAVAVGGSYGEWELVELSPTEAVFSRNGARRTVELPADE